ncbi:hypothetical protein RchiOBHm_Chr6g0254051 [Rosa chinensis]|uniref:Uncharacterized protein n=1 Tax=Rosa chinensis TaxID=74649 RepID=A0A2P6PLH3_ROSCH|nr:hypothetical protein RchiOBHm_Chr6g0254051 [Rosa chinensis]
MLWVHKNHPLTLALNLRVFGDLGLFKDLLGILHKVLEESICGHYLWTPYGYWWTPNGRNKVEEVVAAWRRAADISKAKIAVERYQNDQRYQNLHNQVADLFSEFLKSDVKFLESGEIENISFAAKFCPSIDSKYDKATLICEVIAKRIFPRVDYEEYKDISEPHYAYRVRNRLQKQVLVPLHKVLQSSSVNNAVERKKSWSQNLNALNCLETYWEIYNYRCSIIDRDLSQSRLELFKLYMKIMDRLGIKIDDRLKLPHQVIAFLNNTQGSDEIAELQWQKLVQGLSNKGKLRICLAVCDSSLSMIGTDKEMACIAMGLLISELSESPWNGVVFSFTDFPKIHKIVGESLRSKCEFMRQMECDEKVDCLEIYNRVLEIATTQKLNHIKMPKRVFVFTYKDFVEAFKYDWPDDYTEAYNNFRKRGFEFNVPELEFWNLKDSIAKPEVIYSPVKENQKVGIIITGFSSNLLTLFLKGEADSRSYAAQFQAPYGIDLQSVPKLLPRVEDVFDSAISREELESLVLFD